ncbi:MAG: tyrosine--tRNA ligase [Candidatus Magasanikbacteria bacterium]|nr:tyrosine--tRNA ligase [Candidatus Magasanikbacteria bacterium]MCA9390995.1 tyrosine--tRNA ligase [Candidatus Magasanikbacteria bacterium]
MKINTDKNAIGQFLSHGIERVLPTTEGLKEKLLKGERISAYLGMDATGQLHLGHALMMGKLAELQALGHHVILLIGTFTSIIGDPTDKTAARVQQTPEQVKEYAKNYLKLASRFLSFDGENPCEVRYNGDWYSKMTFEEVIQLSSHFTVQQMLERDMFEKRMKEDKPIYLHEFFYPLMQGYDSVVLDVDLEIGGNDQTFNMLAGRDLMKSIKGKEKFVMAHRLLVDENGKKMGKTDGNGVNLEDDPVDVFGKVMRWPDTMLIPTYELCTKLDASEIAVIKDSLAKGENPMQYKKDLAYRVTKWIAGEEAAEKAQQHFETVHQKHEKPEDIAVFEIPSGEHALVELLVSTGLCSSKTDARKQIEQGGVRVKDEVTTEPKTMLQIDSEGLLIQKGKRHFVHVKGV